MTDNDSKIETKISAARTRLIIEKPFLGALVLRLPVVKADPVWCNTTATDARAFYYNANYIEQLSLEQTQCVLAHEALHCALSHFARRQHRDKQRWDVACDFAINPLLVSEGLSLPPGALMEDGFAGMTAEEIYPSIEENCEEHPQDKHVYDNDEPDAGKGPGGSQGQPPPKSAGQPQLNEKDLQQKPAPASKPEQKQQSKPETEPSQSQAPDEATPVADNKNNGQPQPPPLTETERDNLDTQWQQRLAGAAQQAMQAGKLGGDMARLVDHLLQPRLPWRNLLAHYMTATARDDYSYTRPSTRRGDPAIYPSLRSGQINIVIALDTSGSVKAAELAEFVSEIDAIKSQIRARLTLQVCDAALADDGPWLFEPWEAFQLPREFKGGGATDFKPVFQWLEQQDSQPDLLVYFTDADGEFPDQCPACPVLWLVKGKATVPWGQRIQLN